jgi:cell wall-associated NlpC family hydrolase
MKNIRTRASRALATTLLVAALGAAAQAPAMAAPTPVGSLSSSSCPAAIKAGQTSGCVTRLQNLLNAKAGAGLVVDGIFGNATTAAVKKWQSSHGLVADGVVGPLTKNSLDPQAPSSGRNAAVVRVVGEVMAGKRYPYVWGGGHGSTPGPTNGGMDCSGFTRWVYAKAYGYDVLGATTAAGQSHKGAQTSSPQAGDLVLFSSGSAGTAHHVAIYLGGGRIAEEPHTGLSMRYNTVSGAKSSSDHVYYVHVG